MFYSAPYTQGSGFASMTESSLDQETWATRGDRQGDGDIGQQITWLVEQSGMPIPDGEGINDTLKQQRLD